MSRSRTWGRAVGGAITSIAAVLLVTSCGDGASAPQPGASAANAQKSSLDRAVQGINRTRDPLVSAMNAVIAAANHVDAVDSASATGDWKKARKARQANTVDAPRINDIVGRLPALLRAYSGALGALSTAAKGRDVPVRVSAAVNTVVRAGRAEVDADGVFVRGVADSWPAYAVLAGQQVLWYERASGDWYDGTKQAAQAYAVLTTPLRTTTSSASDAFGKSDTTRRAAADQWAATLEEVQPILYPPKQ